MSREYKTCKKCGDYYPESIFWHPTTCCFVPSIWVDCGIALEGYWYPEYEHCQETIHDFHQLIDNNEIKELMQMKHNYQEELKCKIWKKY